MRWPLLLMLLLPVNLASATIFINEVMPHTNNLWADEWIELYNSANETLVLDNWKIGDIVSNDTINLNISAGGFALIVDTGTYVGNTSGCAAFNVSDCIALTTIGSGLNDNNETIFLYDNSSAFIDGISWSIDIKSSGKSWSRDPDGSQNISMCNPTPGLSNNCSVPPPNPPPPQPGQCDLSVDINTSKIIYDEDDSIDYDLLVTDLNCNNIEHSYEIEYKIEDLFGDYLRTPYTSTYSIKCSDKSSHTKKAEELCGSEAYLIKAEITGTYCNDYNSDNNEAEYLIIVKGKDPEDSSCSSEEDENEDTNADTSSAQLKVDIADYPKTALQGTSIATEAKITSKYNRSVSAEVYSYVFQGQKVATEGGWTGNKKLIEIKPDETKTITLENKIKPEADHGLYSLRIRAAVDDKKYDATVPIEVIFNPNTTIISEKSAEIVSFYTRTRIFTPGKEIKLYSKVQNLLSEMQNLTLKFNNQSVFVVLEPKEAKTFNFTTKLPEQPLVIYNIELYKAEEKLDEQNLTLEIEGGNDEDIVAEESIGIVETEHPNIVWSSKSSFSITTLLFSAALLILSLSLLATAVSQKRS